MKSAVGVQTGTGNLVESASCLSEGGMLCCYSCTTCAPLGRAFVSLWCSKGGREPVVPLITVAVTFRSCAQFSSRLRNGAEASRRGDPFCVSNQVCQARKISVQRYGAAATLVGALQACSPMHTACMSTIECTWWVSKMGLR